MDQIVEKTIPVVLPQDKTTTILKLAKKELPFAIGSTPFIWQIIFLYLPLLALFTTCFLKLSSNGAVLGVTFDAFLPLLNWTFIKIIGNSLLLSAITTLLCVSIGFPLAYCIAFHCGRLRSLMIFLIIIPFWTNFILHIFAWGFILENHGFLNTVLLSTGLIDSPIHFLNTRFATYLMCVYYYLPFMVLPIFSSMERFDASLLEASLDLGASKAETVQRILLPLTMGAIRVGIFLVFIPSFGEFIIPEFMEGGRRVFVGSAISQYVLGPSTAVTGIALTVLSLLFLLPAAYIIDRACSFLGIKLAGYHR